MTSYTDEERQDNYQRLLKSIKHLRNGGTTNAEDVKYYKKIREYAGDFTQCNVEVTDKKFRRKAYEAEQMARYIDLYLSENGTLEPTTYVQFLERGKFLTEFLMTPEEVAESLSIMEI